MRHYVVTRKGPGHVFYGGNPAEYQLSRWSSLRDATLLDAAQAIGIYFRARARNLDVRIEEVEVGRRVLTCAEPPPYQER